MITDCQPINSTDFVACIRRAHYFPMGNGTRGDTLQSLNPREFLEFP
jgi:hypothetical protein